MKRVVILLLALFVLISCNETINEPQNEKDVASLGKRPPKDNPRPPKDDPEPPAVFPHLDISSKHIAGRIGQEIFIWETSSYSVLWSYRSESILPLVAFVNLGSDNKKELILIESLQGGKGKNKYSRLYFSLFTEGVTEPQRILLGDVGGYTNSIWDLKVGNIDSDTAEEIILTRRNRLEVYELGNLQEPEAVLYYPYNIAATGPWTSELTDYNSDGVDEILIAFSENFWASYKYSGSSLSNIEEGVSYPGIGTLNVVKAADLDNDGNIEVIGGGSSNNILVWEDVNTIKSTDPYPDYKFTWALDVAEFDDNPATKEIIYGVYSDGIYSMHYDNENGFDEAIQVVSNVSVADNGIIITDVDGTGDLKIIVGTYSGLRVFDTAFNPIANSGNGILEELVCK